MRAWSLISCCLLAASCGSEATTEAQALIDDLVSVGTPGPGYHPSISGGGFVLVPEVGGISSIKLGASPGKVPAAFRRLVELGPEAVPDLLDALTDERVTELEIRHSGSFGLMWFDREVSAAGEEGLERELLSEHPRVKPGRKDWSEERRVDRYTMKVGDLCFAALGQIVNRPYEAARHQPTNCVVINSPVESPEMASYLRALWGRESIASSLRRGLDSDDRGRRAGAAARLYSYFPEEGIRLIQSRVLAGDSAVIEAACFLEDPELDGAIDSVARTTRSPWVLAAASGRRQVLADPQEWLRRARSVVESADPSDADHRAGARKIAYVALEFLGQESRPWFAWAVAQDETAWKLAACEGSRGREARGLWLADALGPLLDDTNSLEEHRTSPWLVCDAAAIAVALALGSDLAGARPPRKREAWREEVRALLIEALR